MRLTLSRKIVLGMTVILTLAIGMAAIVYWGLYVAQRSLKEVTGTAAPVAALAYELESHVLQTQIATFDYLDLGRPSFREEMLRYMREFEEDLARYRARVGTTEAEAIDVAATALLGEFRVRTLEIVDNADSLRVTLDNLARHLAELDNIVDNDLRIRFKSANREQIASLRTVEVNAAETVAWLNSYLRTSDPKYSQQIKRNVQSFEHGFRRLRAITPDDAASESLGRIDSHWLQIKHDVEQALKYKIEGDRLREQCIELRGRIGEYFRDNIQSRAMQHLAASNGSARDAYESARRWLLVCVPLLAAVAGIVGFLAWRSLRSAVEALQTATQEVGAGKLDYRISPLSDDEFGDVGRGFNEMAAQLQAITVSRGLLAASEEKYRNILENMEEGYYEVDLSGRIVFANSALGRIFGYSNEELLGSNYRRFIDQPTGQRIAQIFGQVYTTRQPVRDIEAQIIRKDGGRRDIWASAQLVCDADGHPIGFRGLQYDVTERKHIEQRMEHQSAHDALTGLPNRYRFQQRLDQAIQDAKQDGRSFAVVVLDLDHFKEINDTLSHSAGDELLMLFGNRLESVLRRGDMLARLGGDEFALLLPEVNAETVDVIARKLMSALDKPFTLNGAALDVRASGGIALCPVHGDSAEVLMKNADIALYIAKRERARCVVYSPEHDSSSVARLTETAELRMAIERSELQLYYQPIVRMSDRRPISMEALARWPHPVRGMIPPAEFIPQAERHGLIKPLTLWVIEQAARHSQQWRAAGIHLPLAINLSPVALRDGRFLDEISATLDRIDLPRDWLECEVTENASVELEHLIPLRRRGARLHIDDFGTGYSSLSYLCGLQVDVLKVDRSFVIDLDADNVNDGNRLVVQAIIQLAHSLGISVIAEGVETEEAWNRLRGLGCDAAQGYYISRPMPQEQVLAWVQQALQQTVGGESAA